MKLFSIIKTPKVKNSTEIDNFLSTDLPTPDDHLKPTNPQSFARQLNQALMVQSIVLGMVMMLHVAVPITPATIQAPLHKP